MQFIATYHISSTFMKFKTIMFIINQMIEQLVPNPRKLLKKIAKAKSSSEKKEM